MEGGGDGERHIPPNPKPKTQRRPKHRIPSHQLGLKLSSVTLPPPNQPKPCSHSNQTAQPRCGSIKDGNCDSCTYQIGRTRMFPWESWSIRPPDTREIPSSSLGGNTKHLFLLHSLLFFCACRLLTVTDLFFIQSSHELRLLNYVYQITPLPPGGGGG